jgi:two-component system sensor histidine kinase YesM
MFLEYSRFYDRFSEIPEVKYDTLPSELLEGIEIPPLLIQPFIENAFKYSLNIEKNNLIKVDFSNVSGFITISISDSGKGLSKEQLYRFNNFKRSWLSKKPGINSGIEVSLGRIILYNKLNKNLIKCKFINNTEGGLTVELTINY